MFLFLTVNFRQDLKNRCQVLSQRPFPKRQLPKGIFPSGNFPTVKFSKRQLPKYVLAAALGHQSGVAAALGPLARPSRCAFEKLPLGKLYIWEIVTQEVAHGNMALGKYLTPKHNTKNIPKGQVYQKIQAGSVQPLRRFIAYFCILTKKSRRGKNVE